MEPFSQVTVVGTGLIGGSFGLALKQKKLARRIVGIDRPEVLRRAMEMGAIDEGVSSDDDPRSVCAKSEVVFLATPVGGILDWMEKLAPLLPAQTLLTDAGSTKQAIASRAKDLFGAAAGERFLPGHPMAGKEHSGIEHADAGLFSGAAWIFTTEPAAPSSFTPAGTPAAKRFVEAVGALGARVIVMPAERHDEVCAWVSHLQQMVATAMAGALAEYADGAKDADLFGIGGRALREMTRIAGSPYSMWRDIALTNTANLEEALLKMEQRLAHIRESLRSPALREEFEAANRFVRDHRGRHDQRDERSKR